VNEQLGVNDFYSPSEFPAELAWY